MVQPVQMQLSHLNLEHAVKNVHEATAQALQTGREGEAVAAAVQRDQTVQPFEASEEPSGVRVRKERERQEGREKGRKKRATGQEDESPDDEVARENTGRLDFYA